MFLTALCIGLFGVSVQAVYADVEATLGIEDYTSGDDWTITDSKGLTANIVNKPSGKKYYLEIELAKGMRLASFLWNSEWTALPEGVRGTARAMDGSFKGLRKQ